MSMSSQTSIPERFKVKIGGFLGPSYSIRIKENELIYRVNENEDDYKELVVTPSEERWQNFKQALDDIGVWQWNEEYPNPGDTDGTQWFLEIEWDGRTIKSYGDDNYPTTDGTPENNPELSPTFENFLEAVRKLIGGLKFR